ncbi:MAG TPA: hypothetical protein VEH77_00010 [Roseiarcus sp.]|nr:hypothetical protein [Roseiarcus sp.]
MQELQHPGSWDGEPAGSPEAARKAPAFDGCDAFAIARLRTMIARSEARKERQDFAEAIRRLEIGAARAMKQNATLL